MIYNDGRLQACSEGARKREPLAKRGKRGWDITSYVTAPTVTNQLVLD